MITAALDAGAPASWVAGDEVYGADPTLRKTLEDRGVGYVLAIASNRRVTTGNGTWQVDTLAAALPARSWQRLSAGAGSRGQRMYSWAWIPITGSTGHAWVLLRRNDTTGEIAYYRTFSPRPVPLPTLVKVAGQRWRVEECFQTSKGLTGLDQHQVRRWTSWHRWVTLAMLAHAFLTVITAEERAARPAPDGLIPITVNELRTTLRRPAAAAEPHPATTPTMVTLAPTTPSPSPRLPLPPTRRITMITNYDCSTRLEPGARPRHPNEPSVFEPATSKKVHASVSTLRAVPLMRQPPARAHSEPLEPLGWSKRARNSARHAVSVRPRRLNLEDGAGLRGGDGLLRCGPTSGQVGVGVGRHQLLGDEPRCADAAVRVAGVERRDELGALPGDVGAAAQQPAGPEQRVAP